MSQRAAGDLLGRALSAQLPLSTGTMRELLVAELERRARAELALEVARERALELLNGVNAYQLLVTHVSRCVDCTRSIVGCARQRELAANISAHLERAAALAK